MSERFSGALNRFFLVFEFEPKKGTTGKPIKFRKATPLISYSVHSDRRKLYKYLLKKLPSYYGSDDFSTEDLDSIESEPYEIEKQAVREYKSPPHVPSEIRDRGSGEIAVDKRAWELRDDISQEAANILLLKEFSGIF